MRSLNFFRGFDTRGVCQWSQAVLRQPLSLLASPGVWCANIWARWLWPSSPQMGSCLVQFNEELHVHGIFINAWTLWKLPSLNDPLVSDPSSHCLCLKTWWISAGPASCLVRACIHHHMTLWEAIKTIHWLFDCRCLDCPRRSISVVSDGAHLPRWNLNWWM